MLIFFPCFVFLFEFKKIFSSSHVISYFFTIALHFLFTNVELTHPTLQLEAHITIIHLYTEHIAGLLLYMKVFLLLLLVLLTSNFKWYYISVFDCST